MVLKQKDPLTGAERDALFISKRDADRLGIGDGERVLVRSEHGELRARAKLASMRPGNVQT